MLVGLSSFSFFSAEWPVWYCLFWSGLYIYICVCVIVHVCLFWIPCGPSPSAPVCCIVTVATVLTPLLPTFHTELITNARLKSRREPYKLSDELKLLSDKLAQTYTDPDGGLVDYKEFTVPDSLTQAYAVQGAAAQKVLQLQPDYSVVGYKLGATDPRTAISMRLQSPFYGPLFAHRVLRPEVVKGRVTNLSKLWDHENVRGIAPHLVFIVEKDFIAGESYHELQILDSIGRVYPGVEVVSTRYKDVTVPPSLLISDFGATGGLVLGTPIKSISQINVLEHPAKVMVNDEKVTEGNAQFVMGDPMKALTWFVNKMTYERGVPIPRGACIAGGSLTGPIVPVEKGDIVKVEFGDLGTVSLQL